MFRTSSGLGLGLRNSRVDLRALKSIWTPFSHTQPALTAQMQTRGKRSGKKGLQPGAQRLINMLSVFSARKKQPRRLKLCLEDLIRHNTVRAAWRMHMENKKQERNRQLRGQYELIQEACAELEAASPFLFAEATKRQKGVRFSPEMRVPVEYPPTVPFHTEWKRADKSDRA